MPKENLVCPHNPEDRDFWTEGVVYGCNCGAQLEVCDLVNLLYESNQKIAKLTEQLNERNSD